MEATRDRGGGNNRHAQFSTARAYDATVGEGEHCDDKDWKLIWKQKVPNKIYTFLWLLKHDRLMTNVERCRKRFIDDEACSTCQGLYEDRNYIFRHCRAVEEIWKSYIPREERSKISNLGFDEWLSINLRNKRNEKVFEYREWSLQQKLEWISKQEVEIRRTFANAITPGGTQGIIVERSLRWKPKTKEELILNVDGSFREENRKKFNAHNPREVKLMALEMGLEWVRNMGINRLEIQCDNVDVVSALCSGIGRGETECRILYNCKRMIGGGEERKLVDVFWSNKQLGGCLVPVKSSGKSGVAVVVSGDGNPSPVSDDVRQSSWQRCKIPAATVGLTFSPSRYFFFPRRSNGITFLVPTAPLFSPAATSGDGQQQSAAWSFVPPRAKLQWIKESLLGRVLRDAHQGTWLSKQGRRSSGPNKRPMEVMRLGILPMTFSSCLQEKKRWSHHHSHGISPEKSRASNTVCIRPPDPKYMRFLDETSELSEPVSLPFV
nr:uncharacterized protein LOC109169412 [Ipomoea batatas]